MKGQLFAVFALIGAAHAASANIVRLDPRFDQLLPRDAKVEKIAGGFAWVEGPVWNRQGNYLLFTDIPNNAIYKWQEGNGASLFLKPSGYTGSAPFAGREPGANGLTFDREGLLVLAEHGDRRVARLEADGSKTTLAEGFEEKRINSPNDLVFKSNGDLYFTDPPFGLAGGFDDPAKELPFQGVYRLSRQGELKLLTKDIKAPNGIAFSPDEKVLYVSDASRERPAWLAFDVYDDGTIGNGRVFYDGRPFTRMFKGGPDGMKVDARGNMFSAGPAEFTSLRRMRLCSDESNSACRRATWLSARTAVRSSSPRIPQSIGSGRPRAARGFESGQGWK